MDEISQYNAHRWQALAAANALFTRPALDLDTESAQWMVNRRGDFDTLEGQSVLLLAGGGGKQSAAYALLGAQVTAFDLSQEQLQRDQQVAEHYQVEIETIQGDMRDLSALPKDHYDIVDQPYSLNFVPNATEVFAQVAQVIKPGGLYRFMCANPFVAGMTERDLHEDGYVLRRPYVQGERIVYEDQPWVYDQSQAKIDPPQEFRQTLSSLIAGLRSNGFNIEKLHEDMAYSVDIDAEPGTWEHFTAIVPPWFTILTRAA